LINLDYPWRRYEIMVISIRSRLALSFAGIALVAALALGVVLLAILRNYYSNLELAYLRTNAEAIGGLVAGMTLPRDKVQSHIEELAFLTQTRIQVFSADNALLYDSGSPQNLDVSIGVMAPGASLDVPGDPSSGESYINVARREDNMSISPGEPYVSAPAQNRVFASGTYPLEGAAYNLMLNGEPITRGARSKAVVTLHRLSGKPVDIRLSEGPAYGTAILTSVAQGWVFASMIAVLLAAGVGWYISRRISAPVLALTAVTARMAQGNLSGRANINSRDEFGQLALSFNEMADQVETTITTLRRFVTDAAHELRTPLAALRMNLDLAMKEKVTTDRTVFLTVAQATVKRLEKLSTNLLDLSRLEANSHADRDAVVDLTSVLQERSELYASQAEQAGLVFEVELPPKPILIRADHSQITRAMDNLVDNACKFTPPDGTVRVALSQVDGQAIFSVADTGIGIPADELPQLFNRFHRGRNTMPYPGSGLGIAIVKAIVTAHGGNVEVQSRGEGRGSRFSIRLPAVSPQNP
jgi:signal transduction histidine kinase